ncbi:hypothetical protein BP6252_03045 [Coleophoma cylindrospora]|uniref:Uncharacterized protein n=1 Tax=Coleophoma cylindrospora TaxID=1849047 RepID=A0A3D8S6K4_9HELO|nr:hypothetical protein BP6252_03045 [Coleophoma cylindrospora]
MDGELPAEPVAEVGIATEVADSPQSAVAVITEDPSIVVVDVQSDSDSAYYTGDEQSQYRESFLSSVREYRFEHGRRYHSYHSGSYQFPNDDNEQDRLDMFHHMLLLVTRDQLHLAPIKGDDLRILDVGTGTGIWAIQMGDAFPSAQIFGNDLSPIQPTWTPPNVHFLVDDVEQEWADLQPYDYIHVRYMAASIKDWPSLVKQCFDNLKPGGWVEFQDFDTTCRSQDDSIPDNYHVAEMLSLLRGACDKIERRLDPGPHLEGWVRDAGFENITHKVIPLPLGLWPKDKKMKEIGAYMMFQYTEGVEAFILSPFTRLLGWTKAQVEEFSEKVQRDAQDRRIHTVHNL